MQNPEPEFWVVMVLPYSTFRGGFLVEAVFTNEQDAIEHASELEASTNY